MLAGFFGPNSAYLGISRFFSALTNEIFKFFDATVSSVELSNLALQEVLGCPIGYSDMTQLSFGAQNQCSTVE